MDAYAVLGIAPGAAVEDVKKAYRALSKTHHPDRGGSEAKFKEINHAYELVMSGQARGTTKINSGFSPGGFNNPSGFWDMGGPRSGPVNVKITVNGVEFDTMPRSFEFTVNHDMMKAWREQFGI